MLLQNKFHQEKNKTLTFQCPQNYTQCWTLSLHQSQKISCCPNSVQSWLKWFHQTGCGEVVCAQRWSLCPEDKENQWQLYRNSWLPKCQNAWKSNFTVKFIFLECALQQIVGNTTNPWRVISLLKWYFYSVNFSRLSAIPQCLTE